MSQQEEQQEQQPPLLISTELSKLIDDITDNTLKIRKLFKQIDELALKEGFSTDEIDLLIHEKYKELLLNNKSIVGVTNNNNNNNPNSSYPYSHQYFK